MCVGVCESGCAHVCVYSCLCLCVRVRYMCLGVAVCLSVCVCTCACVCVCVAQMVGEGNHTALFNFDIISSDFIKSHKTNMHYLKPETQ